MRCSLINMVLLTLFTCCAPSVCSADVTSPPDFETVYTIGSRGVDFTNDVAVDRFGNLVATGVFCGTVDFDPAKTKDVHTPNGCDIYVTKTWADGTYAWTAVISGTASDEEAYRLVTDAQGDILLVGFFRQTVDFDPGSGEYLVTAHNLSGGGNLDFFITKISNNGSHVWTRTIGSISNRDVVGLALALGKTGNLFAAGYFSGTVDFNPAIGTEDFRTALGALDQYVLALDGDGNFLWVRTAGGAGALVITRALIVDSLGYLRVAGRFTGNVLFDATDAHASGSFDGFVTKLLTDGSYFWTKTISGSQYAEVEEIATDSYGNLYLAGMFKGSPDFDPNAGIVRYVSNGREDVFISKWSEEGEHVWTKTVGGAFSDWPKDIALDKNGNPIVSGVFKDLVDFNPTRGVDERFGYGLAGGMFLLQFNPLGAYRWAIAWDWGVNDGNLLPRIAVDATNDIWLSGAFQYSADFDHGSGAYQASSVSGPAYDAFLLRLDSKGSDNENIPTVETQNPEKSVIFIQP